MSIAKLLNQKLKREIFTTPSHNQKAKFSTKYSAFYNDDVSEFDGYDNLSCPNGAIMMAQGRASEIFETKQTFFITQGSTTSILASMKALINPNDKVLVARNCHKSVYNGLILTGGIVDWFMPDNDPKWGIYTQIDPSKLQKTLELNDYKVFIMTSPTYEGINSDIEKIAKICHNHGTYLLVDEAHGSLYNFSDKFNKTAIQQGADISVNSLHKTAGALNQTSLIHLSSKCDIEVETLQNAINIFHTSSPSYPLLNNIEECIDYLTSQKGKDEINNLLDEIEKIKKDLTRFGVEFYEQDFHDPTKILVRKQGISGFDLSDFMFDEYNIEDELNNSISCLYLTGIGTTKQKLEKLKNALIKVKTNPSYDFIEADFQPHPLVKVQPILAYKQKYYYVKKQDSLLKISSNLLLPYPPGIGILYPGEAIQKWHLDYLNNEVKVMDVE